MICIFRSARNGNERLKNSELTTAMFIRVVPAIIIPITPPPQWDAAVVVTAEVSIRITRQFILGKETHEKPTLNATVPWTFVKWPQQIIPGGFRSVRY